VEEVYKERDQGVLARLRTGMTYRGTVVFILHPPSSIDTIASSYYIFALQKQLHIF
jgi:hypothetical protein